MSALFKKKDDEDAPAPDEGADEAGDAGEPQEPTGAAENDTGTGPPDASSDGGGNGPREGDIDVESTLKDLAARMSKLSSSIEGMQENRDQLEGKLTSVEDRLGRLGSLAEAVSSEYNPFVAEQSPDDPAWDESAAEKDEEEPEPDLAPLEAPDANEPGADADPHAGDQDVPELAHLWEDSDPHRDVEAPGQARPDSTYDLADAPGSTPGQEAEENFARNVLLLEWVGFMLREVGRSGLMDLLEYYQSLGWLDDRTKGRALRVATGVRVDETPTHDGPADWRGDLELHERTLVALERLQGRESPATQLEEVRLDMQRIFDR